MPHPDRPLTEKEKQTLRLILRGHDAKSMARQLGLSVHTVNERLRDARRKLAVSSSREAARWLFEHEHTAPHSLTDDVFGAAPPRRNDHQDAGPPIGPGRGPASARIVTGVLLMSLLLALAALSTLPPQASPSTQAPTDVAPAVDAAVAASARRWLALVDQGRWDESWAATGSAFRALNTAAVWAAASERVRAPLGAVRSRVLMSQENLPAPPSSYEVVKFRTDFANKRGAVETVTLDREGDGWRVVGITVG